METYTCENSHSTYLITGVHNFQASLSNGTNSSSWECSVANATKTYAVESGTTSEYLSLSATYSYSMPTLYPLYVYLVTTLNTVKIKCIFENALSGYTYVFSCGVQIMAI